MRRVNLLEGMLMSGKRAKRLRKHVQKRMKITLSKFDWRRVKRAWNGSAGLRDRHVVCCEVLFESIARKLLPSFLMESVDG